MVGKSPTYSMLAKQRPGRECALPRGTQSVSGHLYGDGKWVEEFFWEREVKISLFWAC